MQLMEAEAGPLDSLYILQANTTGRAKKIVSVHLVTCIHDPAKSLQLAWEALKQRFGSDVVVATSAMQKLESFPQIRSPSQVSAMEDFRDLLGMCRLIGIGSIGTFQRYRHRHRQKVADTLPIPV